MYIVKIINIVPSIIKTKHSIYRSSFLYQLVLFIHIFIISKRFGCNHIIMTKEIRY